MGSHRFATSCFSFSHLIFAAGLAFALLLASPSRSNAQTSLGPNVLVVYNSADPDSTSVANYYASQRGIPSTNLCAITPSSITYIYWSAFDSTVRTPIRNCLLAVGWSNILYIVLAYKTPYKLIAPDNLSYALDSFLADIFDVYTLSGQYGIPPMAQPYFANAQSQGNVYVPFQSLADYRSQTGVPIFSVWRLDA